MGSEFFKRLIILSTVFCFLNLSAVLAADSPGLASRQATKTHNGWEFSFAPYLWVAGLEGDVAQFGLPKIKVEANFADILENLDVSLMLVGEARYSKFGIFTDLIYVDISTKETTPGPLFSGVRLTSKTLFFKSAGFYRVFDNGKTHLDLLAGLQVTSAETKLAFRPGILAARTVSDSETWVDPIIGAKGRFAFGNNFYLTAWGMIGGFGTSSDLVWDLFGGIGYDVNHWFSAIAGYRSLGVDFKDNGFVFDVVQHGPILGGVLRF